MPHKCVYMPYKVLWLSYTSSLVSTSSRTTRTSHAWQKIVCNLEKWIISANFSILFVALFRNAINKMCDEFLNLAFSCLRQKTVRAASSYRSYTHVRPFDLLAFCFWCSPLAKAFLLHCYWSLLISLVVIGIIVQLHVYFLSQMTWNYWRNRTFVENHNYFNCKPLT